MKCNDGDISISYEYDASGRVTKYIDEEGNKFITGYDSAGNVVKLLDAKGNTIQENTYDELSYLVSSTDALGIETQYNYDVVGNLIKTIESINTAREAETSYEYDKIGLLYSRLMLKTESLLMNMMQSTTLLLRSTRTAAEVNTVTTVWAELPNQYHLWEVKNSILIMLSDCLKKLKMQEVRKLNIPITKTAG